MSQLNVGTSRGLVNSYIAVIYRRAGQDHDADAVIPADRGDRLVQFRQHRRVERVQALGAIEREGGDAAAVRVLKQYRGRLRAPARSFG